jgi:AcrR family transcriptional regulator
MARAGLTPDNVVDAAASLVDRHGWHSLTLSALATRLKVKPPSLYNHVDGLPGLQRALSIRAAQLLNQRLSAAAVGRSGAQALRALAEGHRAFILEHPGLAEGTVRAPPAKDAEWNAAAAAVLETCLTALRAWELEPAEAVHVVRCLRSAVHGFATLEARGGFGLPQDVEVSFRWMVEGIIRSLESGALPH